MNEIIKNEIRELYSSFDDSNSFYEKEYIMALFEYLKALFNEDHEIREMSKNINKKILSLRKESILYLLSREERIKKYVEENKDFFNENIIPPDTFRKVSDNSIFPLRDDNITYILDEFFKSIGEPVHNFYKKINDENRVILGISNEISYTSINNSNAIIFIKNLSDLLDMMVLVHEIGHAYYFNINNCKISERDNIENEIKEEIPAKIMEMKFIHFLRKNGVYEQSIVLENAFDYVFYEYGRISDKFEGLKYIIASDIAKTIGRDVDINEYYQHIYGTDIYNLVLENSRVKNNPKRFYK